MDEKDLLTGGDLARPFNETHPVGLVGIEVECAALDPETGRSVAYHGRQGIRSLLEAILEEGCSEPTFDRQNLVGLRFENGATVSLENGGAVEYSSAPQDRLPDLIRTGQQFLVTIATAAARVGIAIVPGANFPFNDITNVNWMPLSRQSIIKAHFGALGAKSEWGPQVMALTLSTQATFDYNGVADLVEKLQTLVAVSPLATALFVNSPLEGGNPSGVLSRRRDHYTRMDPARTGILPPAIGDGASLDGFIEWACHLPMIYRKTAKGLVAAPRKPFSSLILDGFDDETPVTRSDWEAHLSQIYTDVRLRNTLEVRAVDGPPYQFFATVPAFWTGLTYDPQARREAWQLVRGFTREQLQRSMIDIGRRGMSAEIAGRRVKEIVARLLELSQVGLQARVDGGADDPEILSYLDPLHEVVASGCTFAEKTLTRWTGDLAGQPARYIEAFRVPPA